LHLATLARTVMFLSINGVTNNVIECVVITKTFSVNIKEIVKTFSINSFAFEKAFVSGERFWRNNISSMYSAVL